MALSLQALQQILLKARITIKNDTAANWNTNNPVLMKGEVGIVIDSSSPVKFKVGDGVTAWNALADGQPTTLAQLSGDATHRTVTDAQIAAWNKGTDLLFSFDYQKYDPDIATTTEQAEQKQIVKDIVTSCKAGKTPVIFVQGLLLYSARIGTNVIMRYGKGVATVTSVVGDSVYAELSDVVAGKDASGGTSLLTATMIFNFDGTFTWEIETITSELLKTTQVIDTLASTEVSAPLSANQGRVLKGLIDAMPSSFGTAASKNVGTAVGEVPVVGADGKLSTTVMPDLTITDVFTVASQAAMLALNAQKGDVAMRTDVSKVFILAGDSASVLANWKEWLVPASAVLSVNSKTGTVVLASDDISEGSNNLYMTSARVKEVLEATAKVVLDGGSSVL